MLERRVPRGALPRRNHRLDATSSEAQRHRRAVLASQAGARPPEQLGRRTRFQGRDGGIIGRSGTPIWRSRDHLRLQVSSTAFHFRAKTMTKIDSTPHINSKQ